MKEKSPAVSVILPVYNPGVGITRCLQSLQNQTLRNIELIFVDDLGTDSAMAVVREAAVHDDRIRILTNSVNMGSGPSRNRGIQAARGEYLAFADPDDYVAPDFLERLYTRAVEMQAVIVKGDRVLVGEDGSILPDVRKESFNSRIQKLINSRPLCLLFTYDHWTAIYKRAWVIENHAHYGTSRNSQDTLFLLTVTYGTESIDFDDEAIYYYVQRRGSRVRTFTRSRLEAELLAVREQVDFLNSHSGSEAIAARYLTGALYGILRLQASCALMPEIKEAAQDFLCDLRKLILDQPYCYRISAADKFVNAFVVYGANLSRTAFGSQWLEDDFESNLDIVRRIVTFIGDHPELSNDYRGYLREAFDEAILGRIWKKAGAPDKKKVYDLLRQEAERLPNPGLLTDDYVAMNLFINRGINLFALRNSPIGNLAKRLLAVLRKKRAYVKRLIKPGTGRGSENRDSSSEGSVHGSKVEKSPAQTEVPQSSDSLQFTPKISVILPVYNPGPGIARCIHSLQHQTLGELEFIFIDDCGTEPAMELVYEAARTDPRFRCLRNTTNIGIGPSRNRGIEAAEGEYLAFVDPDDYIAENFFELLYERAKAVDADIVKGERCRVIERPGAESICERFYENGRIRRELVNGKMLWLLFNTSHWTAIYRRSAVIGHQVLYGNSSYAEDTTFLLRVCHFLPRIEFADNAFYYYVFREGSADNQFSSTQLEGARCSIREKINFVTTHLSHEEDAVTYMRNILLRQLRIHAAYNMREEMKACAADYFDDIRHLGNGLPFRETLVESDLTMKAFLDYGENVCLQTLGRDKKQENLEERIDVIRRTVDFVTHHPELAEEYEEHVNTAFSQAEKFLEKQEMSAAERNRAFDRMEVYRRQLA